LPGGLSIERAGPQIHKRGVDRRRQPGIEQCIGDFPVIVRAKPIERFVVEADFRIDALPEDHRQIPVPQHVKGQMDLYFFQDILHVDCTLWKWRFVYHRGHFLTTGKCDPVVFDLGAIDAKPLKAETAEFH
jgi:hypothetical protein